MSIRAAFDKATLAFAELKLEGNIFDGCWTDAQAGNGVLFTIRNQNGTRPDSIVSDVVFRNNVIKNVENFALNLLGWDDTQVTAEQGHDLEIANNVFQSGAGVLVNRGWNTLALVHNTFTGTKRAFLSFTAQKDAAGKVLDAQRVKSFTFRANVTPSGGYGITGDAVGVGVPALATYVVNDYSFYDNVIEKSADRLIPYPAANTLLPAGALAACLNVDGTVKPGSAADTLTGDGLRPGVAR